MDRFDRFIAWEVWKHHLPNINRLPNLFGQIRCHNVVRFPSSLTLQRLSIAFWFRQSTWKLWNLLKHPTLTDYLFLPPAGDAERRRKFPLPLPVWCLDCRPNDHEVSNKRSCGLLQWFDENRAFYRVWSLALCARHPFGWWTFFPDTTWGDAHI